jgi:hypothetical protein
MTHIQKPKKFNTIKKHKYPFIDELVDVLHSDKLNKLLTNNVQRDSDKSIFMMFVVMYFIIYLKLSSSSLSKEQIKDIMCSTIGDPHKRKACLHLFESQFRQFFLPESIKIENKEENPLYLKG